MCVCGRDSPRVCGFYGMPAMSTIHTYLKFKGQKTRIRINRETHGPSNVK